jgi:hypothetical protein
MIDGAHRIYPKGVAVAFTRSPLPASRLTAFRHTAITVRVPEGK